MDMKPKERDRRGVKFSRLGESLVARMHGAMNRVSWAENESQFIRAAVAELCSRIERGDDPYLLPEATVVAGARSATA